MSLVAYYPLDGDANDYRGSNDGTVNGATVDSNGILGQSCYSFDGSNDYVDCGSSTTFQDLTQENFSICFWFKTSTDSADHACAIDIGEGDRSRWVTFDNDAANGKFAFKIDDGSSNISAGTDSTFTDGVWHHAVGLRDSGTMKLYIDGGLVDTANQATQFSINGTLLVGTSNVDEWWTGDIGEVRIYDHALTPTEIQYLHDVVAAPARQRSSVKTL